MGVSKLMDLLLESREVIRNDAKIYLLLESLLLIQLTKSNANIQKIVAFENAFDRLFDVIAQEGYTDGGIVVEDCLLIMLNLLKNNTSNINFFNEGSYIQKLAPMFILPKNIEDIGWSPQKVSNFHCVLQVIRTLVAPSNPIQIITACQKMMRNANLLEAVTNILMALGVPVPADILSETMNTVAEMIRGNLTNQEYFANVMAPSDPPQPAIVVLLNSMNEISQAQVVQTLLPTSGGSMGLTTGQLLCSGLFSSDSLSIWFSAVALSHTLIENPAQKEQLLRVFIATNVGVQPVSLLHQCATYFQQTSKLQAKLGILMLLSMWLSYCPPAVQVFLNVPGAMAFLTAQTSANEYDNNEELLQGLCAFIMGLCVVFNDNTVQNYNKENLSQLIEKRVGVETYLGKLGEISRHEVYSKAAKQPQVRVKHETTSKLLLEYEFCKLFKVLENVIINALGVQRELSNGNMTELSLSEHENALLLQYKDVIRDQDRRLSDIQRQLELMGHEKQHLSNQLEELQQTNLQLQDQNTLLKAQLSTGATIVNNLPTTPNKNEPIEQEYNEQNDLADKLKCLEMESREKQSEIDSLKKEQDDLLELLLTEQELKLNTFKNRLIELGETIEDDPESDNISIGSDN
ncbi:Uso1 / p115 like vesicle tethering protein, head region [Popillia japonica]|uniref:Uso1 / p115 like vesicle tethering protein, head region n=1 Tax=Popillia japonica TaxID=7064 RepID=A0AAW1JX02_POPJA